MRFSFRMFGNLASLKQWNFHRRFKCQVLVRATSMFINLKLNKFNEILFLWYY
jgi:hypothetical protein